MGLLNKNKKVEEVKETAETQEIKEEVTKTEVPPIAPAQAPEMEVYEPEDESPVEETKEEEEPEEVTEEQPDEGEESPEETGEELQPELSYEMVMQGFESLTQRTQSQDQRIQNLEATMYRLTNK